MTPRHQTADPLAKKILLHSRRLITGKAAFLLEAVYALPECPTDSGSALFTDGKTLFYDPLQVITDFQKNHNSIAQQLLHVTAHCLLGHLSQRDEYPEDVTHFDAAADMKAAQFVTLACSNELAHRLPHSGLCTYYEYLPHLPQLCNELRTTIPQPFRHYEQLAAGAHFDSHDRWSSPTATFMTSAGNNGDNTSDDNGPDWQKLLSEIMSGQHGSLPGTLPGFLQEQLSVEDPVLSYSEFLRRFAAPQERMLTDPDSFDPRWYHLGLSYYGNIPILEETEISEQPVLDDLVIALDTSGSCSDEICKSFLRETLGILRDISAGAPRFRVTLMQCDTEIQHTDILESPQQVDDLFHNFTVRGFGGTDFRPVFERIGEMRADGSLPRIRGLLYLSDSYGVFPDHQPDYPTVFLIPEEDQNGYSDIPRWVTCLYFNQDHFTVKEVTTS